jgi:hypothetical protein
MDGVDASRVDAQTITITYGRSRNRIARVNAEGIEEFKIYENSFSAEFGGSTARPSTLLRAAAAMLFTAASSNSSVMRSSMLANSSTNRLPKNLPSG